MAQYHTKENRQKRGVALWLANDQCYMCCNNRESLEVHHIDKNPSNNHVFNLMCLCAECHKSVHRCHIDPKEFRAYVIERVEVMALKLKFELFNLDRQAFFEEYGQ